MASVRIACVKYLNTAPLIEGLEKLAGCELMPAAPARIAGMVERGEADIGLASVVDAIRGDLAMLPVGMIGCDGPTLTVRVFSRVPMDRVRVVHADTESHTSVELCRVLLKRVYGVKARVEAWEAGKSGKWKVEGGSEEGVEALGWGALGGGVSLPETVLLIGDKVVTDAPPSDRYPHQLDLGEAWKGLTGLPFVYAVWMCRGDRAGDERVHRAAALLDRQRRHNRTRLDWIAEAAAAEHRWPRELAAKYLGSLLRYDVGVREREAVEKFFKMVREDGMNGAEGAAGCGQHAARWVEQEPIGAA